MQPDDELCLCFHVTLRKVRNFIRVERPLRASQLSACGGAGTGCGWCRPLLRRLLEEAQAVDFAEDGPAGPLPDAASHARGRDAYRK